MVPKKMEKETAGYSSILAWRVPVDGSLAAAVHGVGRVGHDLATTPPPPLPPKKKIQKATKILLPCPVRIYLCETRFFSVYFN